MHTSVHSERGLVSPGEAVAEAILELLDEPDNSDKRWRAGIFCNLPRRFAKATAHEYKENYIFEGRRSANLVLLGQHEQFRNIPLDSTDDDLKEQAKNIVREMQSISRIYLNLQYAMSRLLQRAQKYGVSLPARDGPNITSNGIYARLTDEFWWLRALRKTHAKNLEQQAIRLGLVHRRAGVYASDETCSRRKEQKKRNRHTLEGLVAVNEIGQCFTLHDLAARGVSPTCPPQRTDGAHVRL